MAEKEEGNFLIKIDKLVNGSYAFKVFLKPNDIIVALDNQFYTFGEKRSVTNSFFYVKNKSTKSYSNSSS